MKFHVPGAVLHAPQNIKGAFHFSKELISRFIKSDRFQSWLKDVNRLYLKISYPFLKAYWFLAAPVVFSVEGTVRSQGKVLLVRRTYGPGEWGIPGGVLKEKESPREGFLRILKDQVGIVPREAYRLGVHYTEALHKRETIHYFFSDMDAPNAEVRSVRIEEVKWFGPMTLPYPISTTAEDALLRLSDFDQENSLFLSEGGSKGEAREYHERHEGEAD